MKTIGRIIRQHRMERGATQEELGNALSVSEKMVAKWEKGRALPDAETWARISEVLAIKPEALWNGTLRELKRTNRLLALLVALTAFFALVVSGFWIADYASQTETSLGYSDGVHHPIDVTMTQLLATPERYDGKLVRVKGVGNLEFEGNALYLSEQDWKHFTNAAVWINLGDEISYEEAQKYNGKYVLVEGIFDQEDKGHMGLFHGAISDVSRYELSWTYSWQEDSEAS